MKKRWQIALAIATVGFAILWFIFPWRLQFICLDCTHGKCPDNGAVYVMTRRRWGQLNCEAHGYHAPYWLALHTPVCGDGQSGSVYFGCMAWREPLMRRPVPPAVRYFVEILEFLIPPR